MQLRQQDLPDKFGCYPNDDTTKCAARPGPDDEPYLAITDQHAPSEHQIRRCGPSVPSPLVQLKCTQCTLHQACEASRGHAVINTSTP